MLGRVSEPTSPGSELRPTEQPPVVASHLPSWQRLLGTQEQLGSLLFEGHLEPLS